MTVARFAALVASLLLGFASPGSAETLVFHAAQSGKQTLDEGEGGGNPFAGALIEILGRPAVALGDLPNELRRSTEAKSRNFQSPDVPPAPAPGGWPLVPARSGEARVALVMVVADYAKSGGAPSLPGARRDAERVAAALGRAGFATKTVVDADLKGMRAALASFAVGSATADAAVVYVTGHGVEVGKRIFVVPGDYPLAERNQALPIRALPLAEIAAAPRAKAVNLLFYAGCRDDPLGE